MGQLGVTMQNDRPLNPRPAATIILVRDHMKALEVYLLRRSRRSGFFPGYFVFPGGVVDSQDRNSTLWLSRVGMDRDEITRRFGGAISCEEALCHCVAGIRETFEEAGVLNIINGSQSELKKLLQIRSASGLPIGWLQEHVISNGWTLNLKSLSRWARWLTPKLMKSHFDTLFFLGHAPPEQVCTPDQREMEDGIWISPEEALAANLKGEVPLSPPTLVTLHELLSYSDTQSLKPHWADRPWGEVRFPRLIRSKNGAAILQPWDPQRHQTKDIKTEGFEELILPPGEPFSRLFLHEGLWKPVRIP